jgi:hypothetical protein
MAFEEFQQFSHARNARIDAAKALALEKTKESGHKVSRLDFSIA